MKSDIRLPSIFVEFSPEPIIVGLDNHIVTEIETAIKGSPLFSHYPEWGFDGIIWWDDQLSSWCGEVWVQDEYVASYVAKNLKELADEMLSQHDEAEMSVSPLLVRPDNNI